jgi:predicted PurR-regulated permease PerM
MAVVDFSGWSRLLAVPALFGAMNFIEGTFITPRVVGEQVGLNPLEAMLALVLGGSAFGLLGLILAIPVAGIAKTLLRDLLKLYRASRLYLGKGGRR